MARKAGQSELTEAAIAERALRLLARREHSRLEMRRKLLRGRTSDRASAGASESGSESERESERERERERERETVQARADAVLDDLEHRGLLSDARFAEAFVRRGVDRGHGPLKIRAGLRSRGVAEDLIDDILTFSDDFWLDLAKAAYAKRFVKGSTGFSTGDSKTESNPAPTSRSEWAKRARFLAARGFASDIIYRTLTRAP